MTTAEGEFLAEDQGAGRSEKDFFDEDKVIRDYERLLGRTPTKDDTTVLVHTLLDKSTLKAGEETLRGLESALYDAGREIKPSDLQDGLRLAAQARLALDAQYQERRASWRRVRRRIGGAILIAATGIAVVAGSLSTYSALRDPAAQIAREHYVEKASELDAKEVKLQRDFDARREKLEEKFYGPLPSLDIVTKTDLDPEVRELLMAKHLNHSIDEVLNPHENLIYNGTSDTGLQIQAKKRRGYSNQFTILIRDQNGSLLAAHSYQDPDATSISELLQEGVPSKSITFVNQSAHVVNYLAGSLSIYTNGSRQQELQGEVVSVNKDHSKQIAKDFRKLYARGAPKAE